MRLVCWGTLVLGLGAASLAARAEERPARRIVAAIVARAESDVLEQMGAGGCGRVARMRAETDELAASGPAAARELAEMAEEMLQDSESPLFAARAQILGAWARLDGPAVARRLPALRGLPPELLPVGLLDAVQAQALGLDGFVSGASAGGRRISCQPRRRIDEAVERVLWGLVRGERSAVAAVLTAAQLPGEAEWARRQRALWGEGAVAGRGVGYRWVGAAGQMEIVGATGLRCGRFRVELGEGAQARLAITDLEGLMEQVARCGR